MDTQKYWEERLLLSASKIYKKGDKSISELNKLFANAGKDINEKVHAFYSKYGVIKEAPVFKTLADGTQVISGTSAKLIVPKTMADIRLKEGTRLTKLQGQLDSIIMQLSKDQKNFMKVTLGSLAKDSYYDTIYEVYKGVGVGTSFNLLDPKVINQLINNPVNGQDFAKRVGINRAKLANAVNQTLNNGIIQGLPNKVMAEQLAKTMGSGMRVAQTLINTEITNTYNQATMEGYKASGIVKQYIYMATLDDRTSDICSELDGQVFDLEKAVVGLNYPPMHPNCRSTTTAYFDKSNEMLERMARNPETGKNFTVPRNMNGKDFKNIYVDKTVTRASWDKKH